jgi:hypothetical protein
VASDAVDHANLITPRGREIGTERTITTETHIIIVFFVSVLIEKGEVHRLSLLRSYAGMLLRGHGDEYL